MTKTPNPGSEAATKQGCTCPYFDNNKGKGIVMNGETAFWINGECPVHAAKGEGDGTNTDQ